MSEKRSISVRFFVLLSIVAVFMLSIGLQAQETTGGLQGVVKDANGAVVPKASVDLTGAAGSRSIATDGTGYYRFANLAPGTYAVTVKAPGFATLKREGIVLEVGHLPTLDLTLKVGSQDTVVEVTAEAPVIDVTTTHTLTNITEDVIAEVPHGRSFQSVIQFAPAARNEPLAGSGLTPGMSAGGSGNGGTSPGNGGNGGSFGFSVAGGADSENSYLVEGQETASLIGGYSHTNVPFEFVQEVQIKNSGAEAEYGGALGGVVNVIMKKGGNQWHGSLGASYESDSMDGGASNYGRYDPNGNVDGRFDVTGQSYQPKKDGLRDVQPSITAGGALIKDRLFAFFGFAPEYIARKRKVDFGMNDGNAGIQIFDRDQQTYYTNARLDLKVSNKLNVFGSWMYQYQRESGAAMPDPDDVKGLFNVTATNPLFVYSHGIGYSAPNTTLNIGADFTITPTLVSTTRFGYFFENYHDFGYPSTGTLYFWQASGNSANECLPGDAGGHGCTGTPFASDPATLPLQQGAGYYTNAQNQNFTVKNADKHIQFDQDIAWFKSGWAGTHNFKFGYQLNRLSNDIFQHWNEPAVNIYPGRTSSRMATTGQYGYFTVYDQGTDGQAVSYNHAFFAQDSWTLGKGVTVNAGIRFEHENVPAEQFGIAAGLPANPIEFGWGAKIAPRIGVAWDVFHDGKLKLFGSYGIFNDEMKLNLAISSFGGQFWNNCYYTLNDANYTNIQVAPGADGRYCTGIDPTAPALLSKNGAGNTFVTNVNFRQNAQESVDPNLKPYRQHESVFGADFQIKKDVAVEVRWDRRRLDHVIEDAGVFVNGNEVFSIVNPSEGINKINNICGAGCPSNVKPNRNYDGVEFRLTKSMSNHWSGMVSYTYSSLRGNYSGLTSTDLADGGGGRNSPNNSRAFDETYFMYNAYGKSSNGLLATDRPNTFKGYAYYQLNEGKRATTTLGIFQTMYQGTPLSSFIDVGGCDAGCDYDPVYVESRGKWADITQDPTTGYMTVTGVRTRRTPWYIQSDVNFAQEFKVNKNNDHQALLLEATIGNLFNQHSALSLGTEINSINNSTYLAPGGLGQNSEGSAAAYSAYEHYYDWKSLLNNNPSIDGSATSPITMNSLYGKVLASQRSRTIRLGVHYTF
jgi:outer membrane receptor protein involved in Fe transport